MAWRELADFFEVHIHGGTYKSPVVLADATAYTALRTNSGRLHVVPDVTANLTITLPSPEDGMEFKFQYGGAAADTENHIIDGGSTVIKGALVHLDSDADAAGDEVVPVYSNGSSNVQVTLVNPDAYEVTFISDGTYWYLQGWVSADTVPAFAN